MPLLSPVASRYVVLVVDDEAHTLATRLGQADIGAEVVSCASHEGAWSALASGRRFSAVVAERVAPEVAQAAEQNGTPVVAVGPSASPGELAGAIEAVAATVPRADQPPPVWEGAWEGLPPGVRRSDGRLVAVCGPGGTGTSAIAAALALAWGSTPRPIEPNATDRLAVHGQQSRDQRGRSQQDRSQQDRSQRARVLLADFALRADQAFLSGVADPAVGLLPLVHIGRCRPITTIDARAHTVALVGCRLLPGLRRPGHWTAVSPAGFDTVLSGLLGVFDLVVADITAEFEGEAETGSLDVEERNHMARRTAGGADLVVVVGLPGAMGARHLALVVNDLLDHGVDPARIQPVVNKVEPAWPRPTGRDRYDPPPTAAASVPRPDLPRVCGLPAAPIGLALLAGANGGRLPPGSVQPVLTAVTERLARLPRPPCTPALVPVVPGSLGCVAR